METVDVPKQTLVDHIVEEAIEEGIDENYANTFQTHDLDWDLRDVDEWIVDIDGEEIVLHGHCEATYSVQVTPARRNPPSKAHPAEWETKTVPVGIDIRTEWTERGLGVHSRAMVE